MKNSLLFSLFLIFYSSSFAQKHFVGIYGGINLNTIILEIDSNSTKLGERVNTNYGLTYRLHLNRKFFLNAEIGIITKSDQIANFSEIPGNTPLPNNNYPLGVFKYLNTCIAIGYREYQGANAEDYSYASMGISPNILIGASAQYDSLYAPLEKLNHEITNAGRLDLAINSMVGRNLYMGKNLNLDLSFGIAFSLLSLYKKGTYEEVKPVPRHFNLFSNLGLQYKF